MAMTLACISMKIGLVALIVSLIFAIQGEGSVENGPKDLPQILIIGDSISRGYFPFVQEKLQGIAQVHCIPDNARTTDYGLNRIDEWLLNQNYDIIHFNWGLWDLRRDSIGISVEEYRENLDKLVKRLKQTGAELIWATTTPVPDGAKVRNNGDVIEYNAVAQRIMDFHEISTNDLYSFVQGRPREEQRPRNVHFTEQGSRALAKQVVEVILRSHAIHSDHNTSKAVRSAE